jgi:hypothetical protein
MAPSEPTTVATIHCCSFSYAWRVAGGGPWAFERQEGAINEAASSVHAMVVRPALAEAWLPTCMLI